MKTVAAFCVALLVALFLAACGGAGSASTTTSTATSAAQPSAHVRPGGSSQGTDANGGSNDSSASRQGNGNGNRQGASKSAGNKHGAVPGDTSTSFTPPTHHDSATGVAPFEAKGGDSSIQEFGTEAAGPDFQAAATALHGYLDARAAGAWSAACSYLAPGVAASLSQLGGSGGAASCPETLASLSTGVSAAALEEAAEADVGALRTEGDRAYLLFRGAHGVDYFMPMVQESGSWKVGSLAPSALS